MHPDPVRQLTALQLHAEHPAQLAGVTLRVEPQHPHRATIGPAQTADNLHGGGLARAVRADDPVDLALPHGKGDVMHRDMVAIALVQLVDLDDRRGSIVPAQLCRRIGPPATSGTPCGGSTNQPIG